MKAKNGYKYIPIASVLAIVFGIIPPAHGNSMGGSGEPITPYTHKKIIREEEVIKVKNIATRNRRIRNLKVKGTNVTQFGFEVGLMYVEDQNVGGHPFFEFKGVSESGDEAVLVFSEVDSFSLIRVDNPWFAKDRALFEVILFPHISPRELLTKKPSYRELKDKYTKTVRLWVDLENEDNGELSIVGKTTGGNKYVVLSKLRDIELNSPVHLRYGGLYAKSAVARNAILWAIDSVIKDEKYPYREILLK